MLLGWLGLGAKNAWRVAVLVSIAATLLLSLTGCSMSCTDVGWREGLTVSMTSKQPLTAGTYHVVIEIPDETFELDLVVAAPENTQNGVTVSEHLTRGDWQVNASLSGSDAFGSDGDISVGRRGDESGGPESISITVSQDGTEIGRLELDEITYRQHEPNGPDCGVATTASATLELSPLQ